MGSSTPTLEVRKVPLYTVDDLEKAKADLVRWKERWANYSGNNANKYQADLKAAARTVREIEQALKDGSVFPLSETELLENELDTAFPNARSKEVDEYQGKKYQRQFWPLEKSRLRETVTEWGKGWKHVEQ